MILGIDTSLGTAVAVVELDGMVRSQVESTDPRGHAEVIGLLIQQALAQASIGPSELTHVAAGMGPGPFTGLRVGIAAARVFALGAGKPLLPLVSHDAIAFGHYRSGGAGDLLVVTDARRRELFWSAYSGCDDAGLPVRVDGPGLAKPAALDDAASAARRRLDAHTVSAGDLGMLAELGYLAGRPFAANEPLYLRSPDVTLSAGPKRVGQ